MAWRLYRALASAFSVVQIFTVSVTTSTAPEVSRYDIEATSPTRAY
ncbi:MAG: hypothetical protein WCA31_13835 [Acidimicrobiales bacterium]